MSNQKITNTNPNSSCIYVYTHTTYPLSLGYQDIHQNNNNNMHTLPISHSNGILFWAGDCVPIGICLRARNIIIFTWKFIVDVTTRMDSE